MGPRLYLPHAPTTAHVRWRVERHMLVLPGDTHGDQLDIPRFSQKSPYTSGVNPLDRTQLYVNRGMVNNWVLIRMNTPPEVKMLILRSGRCVVRTQIEVSGCPIDS